MTRILRVILLAYLFGLGSLSGANAAQGNPGPETVQKDPPDVVAVAYELAQRDMSSNEWEAYVKKATKRYESWTEYSPGGSRNQFLDDELLNLLVSARNGTLQELKRAVYWLALYQPFRAVAPSTMLNLAVKHQHDLDELLADFSWEKALVLVGHRG